MTTARILRVMLFVAVVSPWTAVRAQTGGDLQACASKTQDADKLKCFQDLTETSKKSASPQSTATSTASSAWTFAEDKSPIDDSKGITAMNGVDANSSASTADVIIIRCKEHVSDLVVATSGFWGIGMKNIDVLYRLNDEKPQTSSWKGSTTGKAAFYPNNVAMFVQSLPSTGKLFVRVTGFDGQTHDGTFRLDGLDEVRAKVGAACNWPARH